MTVCLMNDAKDSTKTAWPRRHNIHVNLFSEESGQCLEAAQQAFLRSLLGVTDADNRTTTDMML